MTLMLSTSARWLITASGRRDVPDLLDRLGLGDNSEPAKIVGSSR